MAFLFLLAVTLLATYWTYMDAVRRGMAARRWALAAAVTSGLSLPLYLAMRQA
ncbi:MAG: DUF2834 domain-containing protein [Pseudomonadota bacterium]